jgi:hypothetical protein
LSDAALRESTSVSHDHCDETLLPLGDLAAFAYPEIAKVIVTWNVPQTTLADWLFPASVFAQLREFLNGDNAKPSPTSRLVR